MDCDICYVQFCDKRYANGKISCTEQTLSHLLIAVYFFVAVKVKDLFCMLTFIFFGDLVWEREETVGSFALTGSAHGLQQNSKLMSSHNAAFKALRIL